jgi:hypothetical protein
MEVWQSMVYCTSLENWRTARFREFESHRFRHIENDMRSEEQKLKIEKTLADPYIIDNFITEDERLQLIKYFHTSNKKIYKNTGPITVHLDDSDYEIELIKNILERVESEVSAKVYFSHFFYTTIPHIIHNDDSYNIDHPYKGINIPLETFEDTFLCVFDQYYLNGPSKFFNGSSNIPGYYNTHVYEYSDVKQLSLIPFNEEFRREYLDHIEPAWLTGLSIKSMYKQSLNTAIVFDTVRLHCSTNFKQSKLGLSFFTKL